MRPSSIFKVSLNLMTPYPRLNCWSPHHCLASEDGLESGPHFKGFPVSPPPKTYSFYWLSGQALQNTEYSQTVLTFFLFFLLHPFSRIAWKGPVEEALFKFRLQVFARFFKPAICFRQFLFSGCISHSLCFLFDFPVFRTKSTFFPISLPFF